MLILQGTVTVTEKDQWTCIGALTVVLDSNAFGSNDGEMIIKQYHHILKPWLQTINVNESSEIKAVLIFYGFLSHLTIYLLNELGRYVMTNNSHETNVEDLVNFGIANT